MIYAIIFLSIQTLIILSLLGFLFYSRMESYQVFVPGHYESVPDISRPLFLNKRIIYPFNKTVYVKAGYVTKYRLKTNDETRNNN
jgi:hypothetical protein